MKHIRNETNLGHVRNFNKGIELARGKYVWLVSADDWLASAQALERYVDFMERNPGVGYTFCRSIEVRGAKEAGVAVWTILRGRPCRRGAKFLIRLIQWNCVVLSAAMFRKECFEKFGLFLAEMPHANDWFCAVSWPFTIR